jgi:NTP pyrophosphatase (non-canonical NTP hydrolase)
MNDSKRERLIMMAEECGEVVQMIGKVLRHGPENYHPADVDRVTNISLFREEVVDILAIYDMLIESGDILNKITQDEIIARKRKKLKYTYHQNKD